MSRFRKINVTHALIKKKINMSISKEISAPAKGSEHSGGLWTARTKNAQACGGAVVFPAHSLLTEVWKELAAPSPCLLSLHSKWQTVRREREESPRGAEITVRF